MKTLNRLCSLIIILSSTIGVFSCSNEIASDSEDNGSVIISYQNSDYFKNLMETMNMPRPADSYNYPVYPTTTEWESMKNINEKLAALVIPDKKLSSMSTQAILQALWEYPFTSDIIHRMRYQKDFEGTYNIAAFHELEKREDAAACMLERYKLMCATCGSISSPSAFEVMFSQPVFLKRLSLNQKKELVGLAMMKDDERNLSSINSNSGRATCMLLIGRAMGEASYQPFLDEIGKSNTLKTFLETSEIGGVAESLSISNSIIDKGKEFAI